MAVLAEHGGFGSCSLKIRVGRKTIYQVLRPAFGDLSVTIGHLC